MQAGRSGALVGTSLLTALFLISCVNVSSLDQKDLLAGLSGLVLQPQVNCEDMRTRYRLEYLPTVDNPAQYGIDYEEYFLPSGSGNVIRVWYMPTRLDRGVVVYAMGNSGLMPCYLFSADLLTSMGWSVVMFEYEGYGLSGGLANLESLDDNLETVVDWTRDHTQRDEVTLMGISLGSLPAVSVGVHAADKINGVILDSPIAMASQIQRFSFIVAGQGHLIIDRIDPDLLSDVLIAQLEEPLLIFSHEQDFIAPPDSVQAMFDEAAGPKQLVHFPELGHAYSQFAKTDAYLFYLETFLAQRWHSTAQLDQPEHQAGSEGDQAEDQPDEADA